MGRWVLFDFSGRWSASAIREDVASAQVTGVRQPYGYDRRPFDQLASVGDASREYPGRPMSSQGLGKPQGYMQIREGHF